MLEFDERSYPGADYLLGIAAAMVYGIGSGLRKIVPEVINSTQGRVAREKLIVTGVVVGGVLAGGGWKRRIVGGVAGGVLASIGKAILSDMPPLSDWCSPIALVRDADRTYQPPPPIPFSRQR